MDCLVIDYGSQYTNLIGKRLNTIGVDHIILPHSAVTPEILVKAKSIILSGSHWSVNDAGSPRLDLAPVGDTPVLGICYGMQMMAVQFGGMVTSAATREYGQAEVDFSDSSLTNRESCNVWMSHGDWVSKVPPGFSTSAWSNEGMIVAIESDDYTKFGVQFHPEATQTECGLEIFSNFFSNYTSVKCYKNSGTIRNEIVPLSEEIARSSKPIVCAISGGVDSLVCYKELERRVSKHRLIPVTIDTGLLRKSEIASFEHIFDNLTIVDASSRFISALSGITDPETKRAVIGKQFINELSAVCKVQDTKFLAQGTIYTDIIESSGLNGTATTIKSHHNVGGLPKDHGLTLIEPLSKMYKDDVRSLASTNEIPSELVWRKPFPGPGLAIRIIGEVTKDRVEIVREADYIVTSRLEGDNPWQVFCVLMPDARSVGVKGDARSYDSTIVIRSVDSVDGMTASVHHHSMDSLTNVADEIVNNVKGIGRVVFDLTSKPPGTIEWE